jgi:glutamyl-tRNA reductase
VVPTIVSLQDHLETIRQAEIDRVRGRLGSMTNDQELAVEALTRGIVNKIMHTPISTLKTAARDPESTTVIELVRRLFNLHDNLHDNLHNEEEEKETATARAARDRGAED